MAYLQNNIDVFFNRIILRLKRDVLQAIVGRPVDLCATDASHYPSRYALKNGFALFTHARITAKISTAHLENEWYSAPDFSAHIKAVNLIGICVRDGRAMAGHPEGSVNVRRQCR